MWAVFAVFAFLSAVASAVTTGALFSAEPQKLAGFPVTTLPQALCGTQLSSTEQLYATCPKYQTLVKQLKEDIEERKKRARKQLPEGPLDVFDVEWLGSPHTRFEWIGVIDRLDRTPFKAKTCGELRLVFRLTGTYREGDGKQDTYLPMTLQVVFEIPEALGCKHVAAQLLSKAKSKMYQEILNRPAPYRVEVNLLNLRIPSPLLEKTAGYAEYLMRSFRPSGERLVPVPLENTPDVQKILATPALQTNLKKWVSDNLDGIEQGTAVLPETLSATRAISIAPFGTQRLANAPFSQLLDLKSLSDLTLDAYPIIDSPERLLRRLNGLSCQGCHQIKSDAGFHFLGANLSDSFAFNRTALPASAHFFSEQDWRNRFAKSLEKGKALPARPLPGVHSKAPGRAGDLCTLGDVPEKYNCAPEYSCRHPWESTEHPELNVGFCQKKKSPIAGEACLLGSWTNNGGIADALIDVLDTRCFGRAQCLPHSIGFPGGLCVSSCESLLPGTVCHPVPALQQFTDCRARGETLDSCFEKASNRVALRSCKIDMPCRPDYVCALREGGDDTHGGACVPPYFLPQLNTRGHHF